MPEEHILVVEDEDVARKNLVHILEKEGYEVTSVESGVKALHLLESKTYDLVLTDYRMNKVNGIKVLEKTREHQPYTEVIMITGYATVDMAVQSLKEGAYHYISKPYKTDYIRKIVKEALLKRTLQLENSADKNKPSHNAHVPLIIGSSAAMTHVKKMIEQIALTDTSVFIFGESGTGKELVAKSIHYLSERRDHKLVAFNCGSFTEDLMANELFGHEKEAFTGAVKTKKGLFEMANQGTVFFDEIGDMPLTMQVKILRVIQEKEFLRVGGTQAVAVDLRFIAATHRNLQQEVQKGQFRQDLFYRLNVFSLHLPPLSERNGDIPLLSYHFLAKKNKEMGKSIKDIDRKALDLLCQYSWPGNVRELENIIERAIAMANGDIIYPENLPTDIKTLSIETYRASQSDNIPTLEEQEKKYIRWVLEKTDWNKTKAAKVMGIDRVSLWRKIKRFNLE